MEASERLQLVMFPLQKGLSSYTGIRICKLRHTQHLDMLHSYHVCDHNYQYSCRYRGAYRTVTQYEKGSNNGGNVYSATLAEPLRKDAVETRPAVLF